MACAELESSSPCLVGAQHHHRIRHLTTKNNSKKRKRINTISATITTIMLTVGALQLTFKTTLFLLFFVSDSKGFVLSASIDRSPLTFANYNKHHSNAVTKDTWSSRWMVPQSTVEHVEANATTDILDEDEVDYHTTPATNTQKRSEIVISTDIMLPFSREVAFDAFSDLSRQPEWSPWLKSVEYTSLSTKNHTVWKMKRILGFRYSWTAKTTKYDRPNSIEWESTKGIKNIGQVEFLPATGSNSENIRKNNINNNESIMRVRIFLVVPRVVSRFMGENSRVARFVQVGMVQKSLRLFRDLIVQEQNHIHNNKTHNKQTSSVL